MTASCLLILAGLSAGASQAAASAVWQRAGPVHAVAAGSSASTTADASLRLVAWLPASAPAAVEDRLTSAAVAAGARLTVERLAEPYAASVLARWQVGDRPELLTFDPSPARLTVLDPAATLVDLAAEPWMTAQAELQRWLVTGAGIHPSAVITHPSVTGLFVNRSVIDPAAIGPGLDGWYTACGAFDGWANATFSEVPGRDPAGLAVLPVDLWADDLADGLADRLADGAAALTDERIVAGVNALHSAMFRGCVGAGFREIDAAEQVRRLWDGETAMIPAGSSILPGLIEAHGATAVDERLAFLPLSMRTPRASWTFGPDSSLSVVRSDDPARQAAALALLRHALGEADPTHLAPDAPTILRAVADALAADAAPPLELRLRRDLSGFGEDLLAMLDGRLTPEDVTVRLQDAVAAAAPAP